MSEGFVVYLCDLLMIVEVMDDVKSSRSRKLTDDCAGVILYIHS